MKEKQVIRIATRQSPLALWQANHVGKQLLQLWPKLTYTLVPLVTSGDKFHIDRLQRIGGKGLFVKELEEALIANTADIAVHSMKDVTTELPQGLKIAAICERDNPFDAFISLKYKCLDELEPDSLVGTASLRRQSQLLALKPNIRVRTLRGNIQTRLERLQKGDFDAILLAAAGLLRMGEEAQITEILNAEQMLPACAQGALGIECRQEDADIIPLLEPLNHGLTALCVNAERQVNARLGGNCHVPLAVFCYQDKQQLRMQAKVLSLDGKIILQEQQLGSLDASLKLADLVADNLLAKGAGALLEAKL